MHLFQIVRERDPRLALERGAQHFGIDVRIAVAVPAYPRPHAQQRGQPLGRAGVPGEGVFHFRIQPRDLLEEGIAVVGKRVVDLVHHAQLGQAQHRRLPQGQDPGVEFVRDFRLFDGKQQFAVAPVEQPRDLALAVERALSLHLGRMRGQHRANERAFEPDLEFVGTDTGRLQLRQGPREAALARRQPLAQPGAAFPLLVAVLGDVEQMREIAEGAHHIQALAPRQAIEDSGQLGAHRAGLARLGAAKAHRGLAHVLDERVTSLAGALLQHPPEQPPQQAHVLAQFGVEIGLVVHLRLAHPGFAHVRLVPVRGRCPRRKDSIRAPRQRSRSARGRG